MAATLEIGAIAWIHGKQMPGPLVGRLRPRRAPGLPSRRRLPRRRLLRQPPHVGRPAGLDGRGGRGRGPRRRAVAGRRRPLGRTATRRRGRRALRGAPVCRSFAEEARRRGLPWARSPPGPPCWRTRSYSAGASSSTSRGPRGCATSDWAGSPRAPRPVPSARAHARSPWRRSGPSALARPPAADPSASPRERGAALDGVRVLDLTWVLAGPYVTKTLAEHGAEIVKVESFHRKDPTRFSPGMRLRPEAGVDDGGYFLNFNRNKRSVALNLRTDEGQDLLRRLVPTSTSSSRTSAPACSSKWGLDYPRLRELNPDVVLVSMAGTGQDGPWRDAVTFADTLAAMSGLTAETGRDDRAPQGLTFGLGDMVAANSAVVGDPRPAEPGRRAATSTSPSSRRWPRTSGPRCCRASCRAEPPPPRGAEDRAHRRRRPVARRRGHGARGPARGTGRARCRRCRRPNRSTTSSGTRRSRRRRRSPSCSRTPASPRIPSATVATSSSTTPSWPPAASTPCSSTRSPGRSPTRASSHACTGTPGGLWEPAPLLGQHTDDLLTELLGLTPAELADLHDQGVLS